MRRRQRKPAEIQALGKRASTYSAKQQKRLHATFPPLRQQQQQQLRNLLDPLLFNYGVDGPLSWICSPQSAAATPSLPTAQSPPLPGCVHNPLQDPQQQRAGASDLRGVASENNRKRKPKSSTPNTRGLDIIDFEAELLRQNFYNLSPFLSEDPTLEEIEKARSIAHTLSQFEGNVGVRPEFVEECKALVEAYTKANPGEPPPLRGVAWWRATVTTSTPEHEVDDDQLWWEHFLRIFDAPHLASLAALHTRPTLTATAPSERIRRLDTHLDHCQSTTPRAQHNQPSARLSGRNPTIPLNHAKQNTQDLVFPLPPYHHHQNSSSGSSSTNTHKVSLRVSVYRRADANSQTMLMHGSRRASPWHQWGKGTGLTSSRIIP